MNKDKLNNVRTAVYLVESSNMKSPPKSAYGTDDDVFCQTCIGDGYIPRNIWLMYSFLDLVQPSIIFDKPAFLENRIVLSWKVNGCLQINKMEFSLKDKNTGFFTSKNMLRAGEKFVCNHDSVLKQNTFTESITLAN